MNPNKIYDQHLIKDLIELQRMASVRNRGHVQDMEIIGNIYENPKLIKNL
jgi:hypothetical protein